MVEQQKIERSTALYQDGRKAMDRGDLDAAVTLFRQSAEMFPHFKTLELLGDCLLQQKKAQDAIIPLAASAGLGANPYRAMFLLAQALQAIGESEEALEKLDALIALDPEYKSALSLRESIRQSVDSSHPR